MEEFIPAAFFLLERAVVKLFQLYPDRGIQFRDREEPLLTQGGCDPCGDVSHSSLGIRLILRRPDAGRNDRRAIVLGHLVIDGVVPLVFPAAVMDDRCLAVIRHKDLCNTAEILIHVDMGINP